MRLAGNTNIKICEFIDDWFYALTAYNNENVLFFSYLNNDMQIIKAIGVLSQIADSNTIEVKIFMKEAFNILGLKIE